MRTEWRINTFKYSVTDVHEHVSVGVIRDAVGSYSWKTVKFVENARKLEQFLGADSAQHLLGRIKSISIETLGHEM